MHRENVKIMIKTHSRNAIWKSVSCYKGRFWSQLYWDVAIEINVPAQQVGDRGHFSLGRVNHLYFYRKQLYSKWTEFSPQGQEDIPRSHGWSGTACCTNTAVALLPWNESYPKPCWPYSSPCTPSMKVCKREQWLSIRLLPLLPPHLFQELFPSRGQVKCSSWVSTVQKEAEMVRSMMRSNGIQ